MGVSETTVQVNLQKYNPHKVLTHSANAAAAQFCTVRAVTAVAAVSMYL